MTSVKLRKNVMSLFPEIVEENRRKWKDWTNS